MATYNRTKVADYAKQYATKTNPNYKRYNLNCTNFVSQAIHAGGKAEVKPSPVKKMVCLKRPRIGLMTTTWIAQGLIVAICGIRHLPHG